MTSTNDIRNGLYPADRFKIGPVCTKLEDPRWFEIDVEDHFTLGLETLGWHKWCFVSQKRTNRKFALFFDSRLSVAIVKQCYRFLWLQNYLKTLKITDTANADAYDFELSSFWVCRVYPWIKFAASQAFFRRYQYHMYGERIVTAIACTVTENHSGLLITQQITGISCFVPFNHLNNLCVLSGDVDHSPLLQCSIICFHFGQFLCYVPWVCTVSGKKQKQGRNEFDFFSSPHTPSLRHTVVTRFVTVRHLLLGAWSFQIFYKKKLQFFISVKLCKLLNRV